MIKTDMYATLELSYFFDICVNYIMATLQVYAVNLVVEGSS